ncbi:hypothetical protein CcI49_13995 [Frankia sp. CcI49]|uniref:serine/threonine-protein kinase n=1 Tax=unclassified Frankia TaxID=2632575 RepID=UPI0006C9F530|nr:MULTISPECIES: serine/threonine-protein kinase [unclassified Frankia]ONH59845.1 hypothetical protein CcI49_13995 [Frankia sp. CcI49]
MLAALVASDPAVVGRYRLEARLGSGGMGTVYLGRDAGGRTAAVKVIRPDLVSDAELRERFRREVTAVRRLRGPFVAEFLDADVDAASPWLAMEYVPGVSLAAEIGAHGSLAEARLVAIGSGLAAALLSAHSAGLVHRDLKPSNILLGPTGPKIIDFGIARALDGTAHTGTGAVLGTVAWMAPEQLLGERAGPAADIFAWAMCLVYAARGRHPFPAEAPAATAIRMLRDSPDLTGVPTRLLGLLTRALDKDPSRRPSADEALTAILGAEITSLAAAEDLTQHTVDRLWSPATSALLRTSPLPGPPPQPPAPVRTSSPMPPRWSADGVPAMARTGVEAADPAAGPLDPTQVDPGQPAGRRRARRPAITAGAALAAVLVAGAIAAGTIAANRDGADQQAESAALSPPQPGTATPPTATTSDAAASPAGTETAIAPAESPGSATATDQAGAAPTATTVPSPDPAPTAAPAPATVALVRYYNGADHTVLTGPAPAGYWAESTLGSIYQSGDVPGTYPLYACLIGSDSFTSGSANCEGQQVVGVLGWVLNAQPATPATRVIIRCRTSAGEHFVSPDAACEGQTVEGAQGYVLTG